MYLGNTETTPPVLQLTGQLTVHMAQYQPSEDLHSAHHLPMYSAPSYYPTSQYPQPHLHTQHLQNFAQIHGDQSFEFNLDDERQEDARQLKNLVEVLEERVRKVEQLYSEHAQKNKSAIEDVHHIRDEIIDRISAHNQGFKEKSQQSVELQRKLEKKSEEMSWEVEQKLQKRMKAIEQQVEEKIERILKQERISVDKIRQQKLNQLIQKLQNSNTEKCESVEKLQDKWKREVQTVVKEEKKNQEELEERMMLRIKEESEVVQVLSNKIVELQEKDKKREKMEKELRKKEMGKLVNLRTPHAHLFHIQGNNITHKGSYDYYNQVLLDALVDKRKFVFTVDITHTQKGNVIIGVVDQLTESSKRQSFESGNAVCYSGSGCIWYGHRGECQFSTTGKKLTTGMKVEVEAELEKGNVTFIVGKGSSTKKYQQKSDILDQNHRQFVPYFEMHDSGDSVCWNIKYYE